MEMQGIRARALAMVQAMRAATDNLSREHRHVLDRSFALLEVAVGTGETM